MADDSTQSGADVIATDHVTTLNGAAVTQSATSPKVQRVKVGFGDDGVHRDASQAFPMPVELGGQNFTTDAGNSSTAALAANATFTGVTGSSMTTDSIAVSVFANQAGTLFVEQSQDNGVNWDISDLWPVAANSGATTVVALRKNAYRVRYVNGATAQTTFRLLTVRNPNQPVMPRTLSQTGQLRVEASPVDGKFATYSGAMNPTNTVGIANALDQWVMQNPAGSGRLIRVNRLIVNVALATAAAGAVSLLKRSTFNTGGTVVAGTRVPHDSTSAASVVTVQGAYSAAPTASGTLVGILKQERVQIPIVTAAPVRIEWFFGNRPGQAWVIRPGEQMSLTVGTLANGAAGTAPTVSGDVEWTEETI